MRHLALLRGINVGGKNLLPMADLARLFVAAGCGEVRTWIQSGNVVFSAPPEVAKGLGARISADILAGFGLKVPVVLRTAGQVAETVRGKPWPEGDDGILHVMFLADVPDPGRVAGLDPHFSPGDAFRVVGRDVYLRLPSGVARTRLTNAWFDTRLGTVSTSRNWRTVTRLRELLGEE